MTMIRDNYLSQNIGQNPIQNGVNIAQQSLVNDDDKRRAMGMAMMRFAHSMSNGKPALNFNDKLSNISQSLLPSVETYQGALSNIGDQKSKMAKHLRDEELLKHRIKMDQERLSLMKDRDRERNALMREKNSILREKNRAKNSEETTEIETPAGIVDVSGFPELPKAGKTQISKNLNGLNAASREINEIKKEFEELMEATKDDFFSPLPGGSLLGGLPNRIKDKSNVVSPDQNIVKRNILFSRMERLQPALERALKGSPPGEALMARFHESKVYPNANDAPNVLAGKINSMWEDINRDRTLSELSLKTGRQISNLPNEYLGLSGNKKSKPKVTVHKDDVKVDMGEDDFQEMSTEELEAIARGEK